MLVKCICNMKRTASARCCPPKAVVKGEFEIFASHSHKAEINTHPTIRLLAICRLPWYTLYQYRGIAYILEIPKIQYER